MKIAYEEKLRLNNKNKLRLIKINSIIDDFAEQGYRLTLRQLYYQLVSQAIIKNKQSEYAKLSSLLVKGRMAGVVDWDAIEDRIRIPYIPYYAYSAGNAISDIANQFRLNRMENQKKYIEVWVEKDALSGVLKRVTEKYHVRLMINRGYSSCTAMHDAFQRFEKAYTNGKDNIIFYLGDHDPSGIDMVRDIRDRLFAFGDDYTKIERVALTDKQIKKYNPPSNPAKIDDPRAKEYIEAFGDTSWEVDALEPKVLNKIVANKIIKNIDSILFEYQIEKEKEQKELLLKLSHDHNK